MGMKIGFWISLLNVSLFAALAMANPFQEIQNHKPICFQKSYDRQHMAAHPNQTVQSFDLQFRALPENNGLVTLDLKAKIQRPKGLMPYRTIMICDNSPQSLHCSVECDGGSADITWEKSFTDRGVVFRNNGFILYGGCGEDVDEKDMIWLEPNTQGDDLFVLDPKAC